VFTGSVCGVGGEKMLADADVTARLQRAAQCLQTLGEHASQAGILLSVEILNHYENNVLHSVDHGLRLVEMADHPAVGIHLDTFHMSMEEPSLGEAIRKAGDKLFHFHSSESHRGTPGTGLVQWAEVANALRDIHYDRFCVIESFNTDVDECWIVEFARTWRTRAASQDELARDGVAFLKGALRSD
jgi:D-psicose/D-tagatose/L-ribulose 3-epimerase